MEIPRAEDGIVYVKTELRHLEEMARLGRVRCIPGSIQLLVRDREEMVGPVVVNGADH